MKHLDLVRYDDMCRAISEAHQFDEVKDIRDKSLALEMYARQAKNLDAERKACEIRLRAERRAGEMLREGAKNGDRATDGNPQLSHRTTVAPPTLSDIGISRDQASKWQKLANVPDEQFESALADPVTKPSTTGILRKANGSTEQMNPAALWLWGRLRDFERDRIADKDPLSIFGEMTDTMQADVLRIAPVLADFLNQLTECADVTY